MCSTMKQLGFSNWLWIGLNMLRRKTFSHILSPFLVHILFLTSLNIFVPLSFSTFIFCLLKRVWLQRKWYFVPCDRDRNLLKTFLNLTIVGSINNVSKKKKCLFLHFSHFQETVLQKYI